MRSGLSISLLGLAVAAWLLLGCSQVAPGSRASLRGTEVTAADSTLIREWLHRVGDNPPVLDAKPEPLGGMSAIIEKVYYPRTAWERNVEGSVLVGFLVADTGDVVETEVLRGLGSGCDEVALNALRRTKFSPGRFQGKALSVRMAIPIQFQLSPRTRGVR